MKQNGKKNKKRENLVEEYVDLGRFFESATTDKFYLNKLNLHEIKNEFLKDYKGEFALNGSMFIGPIEHKTIIRFKKYIFLKVL